MAFLCVCMYVRMCVVQIADQVGELMIRCRYGCKPIPDCPGEYEVDTTGKVSAVVVHLIRA